MNINSSELLLINKNNMKFGNSAPTQTTNPITEPVATAPESAIKTLDIQGQNNIAFQSVKSKIAKNFGKIALIAALGSAAATLQGCSESITQSVDIDMSAIMNMYKEMIELYKQMLDLQQINNQQNEEFKAYLNALLEEVKSGNKSQAEFYALVVEYMMNDTATQNAIYDALESQGKTQQEINQTMNQIYKLMEEGKYKEALDMITTILGNIDQNLSYILEELRMLRDDMNKNHEETIYNQNKQIEYLNMIYQNGFRKEDIDALFKAWEEANANLEKLANNSDKLINLSETQFKALMDQIGALKPTDADYAKFEQMFKLLNMNMQDLFNKYLENEAKAREEYLAQGKDFQANVIGNLTKVNEQLNAINNNMLNSSQYPGLDKYHAAIQASIDKLTDALNNGATDISALLKEVIDNQNRLFEVVKAIYEELGDVSSKMSTLIDVEKTNSQTTQKQLDKVIESLDYLKGNSDITNTILASINNDTAALLLYADKAVNSANQIVVQGAKIEEAIKALADSMGKDPSEITYEELEKLLKEQNQDAFKMFVQFMQDSGLANVSGDLGTVKDLLISINKNTAGIKSLDETAKKVAQIVSNIDWTSKENLAKVEQLIELLKDFKVYCDCNCNGNGSGDNEGTWPGLDDLENMFG